MGVESRHEMINGGQVLDNFIAITADLALSVNQQVVEATTSTVDITVTLPNVEEAAGRTYTIALITDGGFDLIVQDQDESRNWDGDYTMADANDEYVFYSNGRKWYMLTTVGI